MCADDIEATASAIRAHLATHPRAADSLSGITRWWWQKNRYEYERSRVAEALEQLVAEGFLAVRPGLDGEALYFIDPPRQEP